MEPPALQGLEYVFLQKSKIISPLKPIGSFVVYVCMYGNIDILAFGIPIDTT